MAGNLQNQIRSSKVYVPIGKHKIILNKKLVTVNRHICMSEDQAKLCGATYTKYSPEPITITTKKGKTYQKLVPISMGKTPYSLGYVVGVKTENGKKVPNIKWVPLRIPPGMSLRKMLEIVRRQFKVKPLYFQTDASTTRFINVK